MALYFIVTIQAAIVATNVETAFGVIPDQRGVWRASIVSKDLPRAFAFDHGKEIG